mmetsp:Transcript_48818/g.54624  ORF Transcript_48818/g.54624 Transcript_48818/m.54624 type:complete len:234 (+) Transcript_48818:862-1563(+)
MRFLEFLLLLHVDGYHHLLRHHYAGDHGGYHRLLHHRHHAEVEVVHPLHVGVHNHPLELMACHDTDHNEEDHHDHILCGLLLLGAVHNRLYGLDHRSLLDHHDNHQKEDRVQSVQEEGHVHRALVEALFCHSRLYNLYPLYLCRTILHVMGVNDCEIHYNFENGPDNLFHEGGRSDVFRHRVILYVLVVILISNSFLNDYGDARYFPDEEEEIGYGFYRAQVVRDCRLLLPHC